jgi:hypothetical protein
MDVINNTPYPHLFFRTGVKEDSFAAALMARVTYDIVNGKAIPSSSQDWPISASALDTPYGPLPSDHVYRRGGVDLFVFGAAKAPNNQPVKRMEVRVLLPGKIDHRLAIIGDRVWESGFLGMGISEPKPFIDMPLTLSNAFGGTDEWDKLPIPYPTNPAGKGFIWSKASAVGKPLPNIENPQQLITKWNDKPLPVGVVPMQICEPRVNKAVAYDSAGKITKLDPLFFNTAFLEMIAPEVIPGEKITVFGVQEKGAFEWEVPVHSLWANLVFGEKNHHRPLRIDQIGMEPAKNRVFITYRYPFNYTFRPMEKRSISLEEG